MKWYDKPIQRVREPGRKIPKYLQRYEAYLREPMRKPAETTIATYVHRLTLFDDWLAHYPKFRSRHNGLWPQVCRKGRLFYIEQQDLKDFFNYLYNKDYSLAYRRSFQSAIIHFFRKYADDMFKHSFKPDWTHVGFKKSPAEARREAKQYLTPEHVRKLRDYLYSLPMDTPDERLRVLRNRAIFECLVTMGLRKSELIAIEVSRIDYHTKQVEIFGKKTSQIKNGWRRVPLEESAERAIRDYIEEFKYQAHVSSMRYLFPPAGARNASEHTSASLIDCTVNGWNKIVQLPTLHPHLFRHYYITETVKAGAPVEKLAPVVGDEIMTLYTNYYHPDIKQLADDVKAIRENYRNRTAPTP